MLATCASTPRGPLCLTQVSARSRFTQLGTRLVWCALSHLAPFKAMAVRALLKSHLCILQSAKDVSFVMNQNYLTGLDGASVV